MKVKVTWEQVEIFLNKIERIALKRNIKAVYGLPRGGLVLAVMISHRLNIPLLLAPTADCLIVDDICDSGESLMHYYKNSSGNEERKNIICTMYYKENDLGIIPDCWVYEKENEWIVFPWERED